MIAVFIHSDCCGGHWELLWWPEAECHQLRCEKCHQLAIFTIDGPKPVLGKYTFTGTVQTPGKEGGKL